MLLVVTIAALAAVFVMYVLPILTRCAPKLHTSRVNSSEQAHTRTSIAAGERVVHDIHDSSGARWGTLTTDLISVMRTMSRRLHRVGSLRATDSSTPATATMSDVDDTAECATHSRIRMLNVVIVCASYLPVCDGVCDMGGEV